MSRFRHISNAIKKNGYKSKPIKTHNVYAPSKYDRQKEIERLQQEYAKEQIKKTWKNT